MEIDFSHWNIYFSQLLLFKKNHLYLGVATLYLTLGRIREAYEKAPALVFNWDLILDWPYWEVIKLF